MVQEKGERRIACEISVATTDEQEVGNVQKCVVAGYETVVVLAFAPKTLRSGRSAAESLEPATLQRVRFLQPEDFIAHLDQLAAAEAGHEETVREYKVKGRPGTRASQRR